MSEPDDVDTPHARVEREVTERAFRDVFATSAGKRVLFWLLEQAAIYRDAYTGENNDTNYLLGQQATGRRLIGMLDLIDPRFYPQLLLDIAELKALDRAAAKAIAEKEAGDDDDADYV